MAETVRFSSGKTGKNMQIKKLGPQPAHLKYAVSEDLPASKAKDVLIYTLDTDELWHGNGPGFPMTKEWFVQSIAARLKRRLSGSLLALKFSSVIRCEKPSVPVSSAEIQCAAPFDAARKTNGHFEQFLDTVRKLEDRPIKKKITTSSHKDMLGQ